VGLHIVGPAAFPANDRAFRRAGLDYLDQVKVQDHISFASFDNWRKKEGRRVVLLSTKAEMSHIDFSFRNNDILMFGRESAGVPEEVHKAADARLRIPMQPGLRSLNVAVSVAIVLGEALRQTKGFPNG
jgi:tRNA (cytidine/uridine-2'-O-)-methyltransferase